MISSFPMALRRFLGSLFLLAGAYFFYQIVVYDTSPRIVALDWIKSIDRFALPGVPNSLAPSLGADEIRVQMMRSPEQVAAVAKVAGARAVVMQRPGAALLIDGLPEANGTGLESSLQLQLYKTLRVLRDTAQAHLSLLVLIALGATLFWLLTPARYKFAVPVSRSTEETYHAAPQQQGTSAVRVVLVKNNFALDNARVAIGEEHILASSENAFAFARGWILAVRDGSVFDLVDRLGWSHLAIEIFSESDLRHSHVPGVDRGWCAQKSKERGKAYDLVDALSLCGNIAHAEGIPIS
jgi:hypothetical protein